MNLSWILVGLSLLGNVLVIKKSVIGQYLWAISNIGWIIFDLSIENYSQAFLFSIYFLLCIWGIVSWTKEAKKSKEIDIPIR